MNKNSTNISGDEPRFGGANTDSMGVVGRGNAIPTPVWDKIARTGTFKALNGKDYTFTKANFEKIANNYKSVTEKAPIVLGHPNTDDPALGWVKELRVNGDYLEASYEDISDELKASVDSGRYRYKSMALYPDLQRLKHLGFLGAVPPAMDNLGEVSLATDSVSISFADIDVSGDEPRFGTANTNKLGGSWEGECNSHPRKVSFAFDENRDKENKSMDEKLAELLQKTQEEVAELKNKVVKLEEQLKSAEVEKKDAETKLESTETNFAKFKNDVEVARRVSKVDELIKEGKVMPSEKEDVLKLASVFSSPLFAGGSETEELFWKRYEAKDDNGLLAQFSQPKESSAKVVDIVCKL